MNLKKIILTFTLFLCVFSLSSIAQTTTPNGKAKLIEFNNSTAKFTVPEGKTWTIYNVFCERKLNALAGVDKSIRIKIKSINSTVYENGPVAYHYKTDGVMNFPIVFPEKTVFEFEIEIVEFFEGAYKT